MLVWQPHKLSHALGYVFDSHCFEDQLTNYISQSDKNIMDKWGGQDQVSLSGLLLLTQPLLSSKQSSKSHCVFKLL